MELTWGEESPGKSDEFEAERLDPAEYADMQNAGLIGVSSTAPEALPGDESGGLVEVETSSGGSAWKRRLAPRHRDAVRSFFTQPDTPGMERAGSESQENGDREERR